MRILQEGFVLDETKIAIRGGVYVFHIPIQSELVKKLLLGLHLHHTRSAWVDKGRSFFAVGGFYELESSDNSKILAALRFVWDELLEHELVSGHMPDPTEVTP